MTELLEFHHGHKDALGTILIVLIPMIYSFIPESQATSDGDLRFGGSSVPYQGRLEIYHDGDWGTICDDDFGPSEANVACRQMGYQYALEYTSGSYFGPGSGPVMLDRIYCWGSEKRLVECYHSAWKVTDCTHEDDVGVVCFDESVVLAPVYVVAISLIAIFILMAVTSCLWIAVKNRSRRRARSNLRSCDTTDPRRRERRESCVSIEHSGPDEGFTPYPLLSIPQLPDYSEIGDAPPPYEEAMAVRADSERIIDRGGVSNEGFSNEENEPNNRLQEGRVKANTERAPNVTNRVADGAIINTDIESD